MFDSVLLFDRPQVSRLARAELATVVLGGHALAIAALIAAQAWRIDAVPPPNLPAPPLEPTVVVDFAPTLPPKVTPRVAATPEQLAAAPVPSSAPEENASIDVGPGVTPSGSPTGKAAMADGFGIGDGPVIFEGSPLVRPEILVRVDPVYPRVAQVQRRNGSVLLRAEISADGFVRGARVLQASPAGLGFEESALDAVKLWRFRPATTQDGRPVAVLYSLQVNFLLR